jgi:hypothetical protein
MNAPIKEVPVPYLRDYLAEERTFLAWVRAGIALMGFGLVAARYELFADEPTPRNTTRECTGSPSGSERRLLRSAQPRTRAVCSNLISTTGTAAST